MPTKWLPLERLIAAGIAPTQARAFVTPLAVYLPRHGIDTPERVAAFIAQTGHESLGFSVLEESLYYTDPARIARIFSSAFASSKDAKPYARNAKALANRAYAGRNGNGNEASGDGWRFRGRGLIQLTGRRNYQRASEGMGRDWVHHPDELLYPVGAVLSACWYWRENDCNKPADKLDIDGVTRKINPAMAGAADRRKRYARALDVFKE